MELERQHRRSDAAREAAERHVDELSTIHEDQMKHLHKQHEKDLNLLNHQHDQQLRSLKQSYEVKIQDLIDDQKTRTTALEKSMDDDNRSAIQSAIAQHEQETEAEVHKLKEEMAQQLHQIDKAYAEQTKQLAAHKAALEESEARRTRLEQENAGMIDGYQASRKKAAELQEQSHDMTDQLAVTKAKLVALKKEYQANIQDLRNALVVSKEHLQANYEVISALKDDKTKMSRDVAELKIKVGEHHEGVKMCMQQKKDLQEQIKTFKIDSQTYQRKIRELHEHESQHTAAAAEAGQAIESRQTRIRQCKVAIKEAREFMEQEKQKHIALRQDYQDHVDRLASLNEALDKCKQKNISTNQVLQDMSDRYESLRKKSDQMMEEMHRVTEEKQSYEADLKKEQARLSALQHDMTSSRQEMEESLARSETNQKHAYQLLDTCQQKGSACLQAGKARDEYVAKLEGEIKRAMKVLKDDAAVRRKAKRLDEVIAVRDTELSQLRDQLGKLKDENRGLKGHISDFESHRDLDDQILRKHSRLKNQHARAIQWISEMKRHHKDLHKHEQQVGKALEHTGRQLNNSEDRMQAAAGVIHKLEADQDELRDRIGKCLYPGEKERLESQLMQLIKERDALHAKMSTSVSQHDSLYQKLQALVKENEDLRALKTRYEMDTEQMQKIVEQGAELNVELVKSKKLLNKKESQLELLSNQLAALIHRVKTLEERENNLKEKLGYSATPEEIEAMSNKLNSCRVEMKRNVVRFEAMQAAANKLEEQNSLNQTKVSSLVQVLKETENAQQQLHEERSNRMRLEAALKDCAEERKLTTEQLESRIQAVEDQYRQNLVSHEKLMTDSNSRIADLEQQLMQANDIERNTRLRARLQQDNLVGSVPVPAMVNMSNMPNLPNLPPHARPMRRDEALESVERDSNMKIRELQAQLRAIQDEERQRGPSPQLAIKGASLDSAHQLQQLRMAHQAQMRDKEREIMATRSQTYDKLLEALDVANRNPNVDPNDLYAQVRDIRTRGAQREQQSMSDMLRLRAVNQKLATEYKSARALQWDMLHRANVGQRDQILQAAQGGAGAPALYQQAQAYQALVGAQQDFVTGQKEDVTAQLRNQQKYIQELQNQVPKMKAIEQNINLQRFPNLNVLGDQVSQEKRFTVGAVGHEAAEATGQARSRSALESQLAANDASVRGMVDQIQAYMRSPTQDNLGSLQQFAQMSPGQIQDAMKRQAALKDRSAVRSTLVVQPRPNTMGPPGKQLAVDTSTGEVQSKPHGTPDQEPAHRFFASDVSLFGQPTKVLAPTVSRASAQLDQGGSLIAVTYSFDAPGTGSSGQSLKYIVFLHALKELFPKIQSFSPNGTLNLQLVKILANEVRQDMINGGNQMPDGCTYNTCRAAMKTITHIESAMQIMGSVADDFAGQEQAENHMVMTLSVPGSTSRIHIADVLFMPTEKGGIAVPPIEQIKLLDSSWITYLSDVLQEPSTKIDLFFNLLPHAADDAVTSNSNDRLLQVSSRLQDFLSQLKKAT